MRRHRHMLIFICFMLSVGLNYVWARTDTYRVGPGDVLQVQVVDEAMLTGSYQIDPLGQIDFPLLKKVLVSGQTIAEVATTLTEKLKEGFLRDPHVLVTIKDYQSQKVLVLGSVVRPGRYVLTGETRILDVISMAGGLAGAGGKHILLFRDQAAQVAAVKVAPPTAPSEQGAEVLADTDIKLPNREPTMIDYQGLVNDGRMDQNLLLHDGDILNVPKANEVFVLGNVSKPGPVPFENKMTILQAVTLAGGPTGTASTKSTYILRRGPKGEQKISIKLDEIIRGNSRYKPPIDSLKPDDVIVIPESFF